MSAKLFLIKNEDGKYFNASKNYYSDLYIAATYTTSEIKAKELIDYYKLDNHEIVIVTEDEFTKAIASLTVKTILQMDSMRRNMDELRWSIPTISGLNKNLSNFLKNTSGKLKEISKSMFDEFTKHKEDSTDEILSNYEEFVYELSKIEMYDCSELTTILRAYRKDKGSVLGICKKVLRNE